MGDSIKSKSFEAGGMGFGEGREKPLAPFMGGLQKGYPPYPHPTLR